MISAVYNEREFFRCSYFIYNNFEDERVLQNLGGRVGEPSNRRREDGRAAVGRPEDHPEIHFDRQAPHQNERDRLGLHREEAHEAPGRRQPGRARPDQPGQPKPLQKGESRNRQINDPFELSKNSFLNQINGSNAGRTDLQTGLDRPIVFSNN